MRNDGSFAIGVDKNFGCCCRTGHEVDEIRVEPAFADILQIGAARIVIGDVKDETELYLMSVSRLKYSISI